MPDALRRARDAVARQAWADANRLLHSLATADLTPGDCAALADAA